MIPNVCVFFVCSFLSQYCIGMTNLLALVGLYCDLQNRNYMWRSCKKLCLHSKYIQYFCTSRHTIIPIERYDSMSGLHYNILAYRHIESHRRMCSFMHTSKIIYLIDTMTDSTIFFFGFVNKVKLSRLSTYRRSEKLYLCSICVSFQCLFNISKWQ